MKIESHKLSDMALNWAVSKADKVEVIFWGPGKCLIPAHQKDYTCPEEYSPVSNKAMCLDMMTEEGMELILQDEDSDIWWCSIARCSKHPRPQGSYGPTPIIAAWRCFVISRLGTEVDVPEELL